MVIKHLSQAEFEQEVLKTDQPVLVDFSATWCGPCRMLEPVLEELAEVYKDKLKIVKVDVGEEQELGVKYNIMSIPAAILFKQGKEVDRIIGFAGKDSYEAKIKQLIE